jgi:hypothetical protein
MPVPTAPIKKEVTPNVPQAITPQAKVDIRFLLDKMIDMMSVTLPTNEIAAIV